MFIAKSLISQKIYKLAIMLQNMDINVYIYGPNGSGKTFLANFIASNDDIIIENIKTIPITQSKRIIATGNKKLYSDLEDFFSMQIELKHLKERKEDIKEFINLFINQAQKEFKINKKITYKYNNENLNELKKNIYKKFLCEPKNKKEIINTLKDYFEINYTENDTYHSMLKIFDKALIEVLLEKYKSKLQVAKHLKINRNTLSKKVKEIEN